LSTALSGKKLSTESPYKLRKEVAVDIETWKERIKKFLQT